MSCSWGHLLWAGWSWSWLEPPPGNEYTPNVHLSCECLAQLGRCCHCAPFSLSLVPPLFDPGVSVECVHCFPMNNSLPFAFRCACLPCITLALASCFSFCLFILWILLYISLYPLHWNNTNCQRNTPSLRSLKKSNWIESFVIGPESSRYGYQKKGLKSWLDG